MGGRAVRAAADFVHIRAVRSIASQNDQRVDEGPEEASEKCQEPPNEARPTSVVSVDTDGDRQTDSEHETEQEEGMVGHGRLVTRTP